MHETLYEGYQMRSSYEVLFAKRLDRLGVEWEYEPRCFDLGTCTYTPDFYLPETEVFWEVKGWLGPDSQRKTRLFRETFPEISLIVATQPILKPLGAIQ
jgi:predicted nuclease of restriction endonuclease-like RecB superfamily